MKQTFVIALIFIFSLGLKAQEKSAVFEFESLIDLPATPVKSQDRTGTCWSYSTTSFIESEIIRKGGPEINLSEMYFVRYTYPEKARLYVMRHGSANFSEGGQAHDVMNAMKAHGMVPEDAFPGKRDEEKPHSHSELVSTQKALLDNYLKMRSASPNEAWYEVLESVLTTYMGEVPEQVGFDSEAMTPREFQDKVKINPEEYVELSSYSHHPWYSSFNLEVPDNWSNDLYYNLPLDELMEVMNYSLNKGYTFVWDGDVSETHFSHKNGAAIVPEDEKSGMEPTTEKVISQELRQEAFLSWQATDDHLMHITGLSKDQNGTMYYKTKNSWGTARNDFGGYLHMSEAFMRLNTVAIMVHREAIPEELAKKLFK